MGGTRNNRVFAFFDIKAPRRVAEGRLVEADEKKKAKAEDAGAAGVKAKRVSREVAALRGGKTSGALDKKKTKGWRWRRAAGEALPPSRRSFLRVPTPQQGDSKGEGCSSEHSATTKKTPAAPITIAAPIIVKPLFSLQLIDPEPESDDEVQPRPHAASASTVAEKTPEKTATSSEEEEGEDEDDSGRVPSYGGAVAKGKRVSTGASSSDSSSSESSR